MRGDSSPPDSSAAYEYDVCLSFANEDRSYAGDVAQNLDSRGVRVFYDKYETAALWGKDLYEHLDHVYRESARFCVIFASAHYAGKLWTTHERKSAQERALRENQEYILTVRLDDTKIPGLRETVAYIDASTTSPAELADLIIQKLKTPSVNTDPITTGRTVPASRRHARRWTLLAFLVLFVVAVAIFASLNRPGPTPAELGGMWTAPFGGGDGQPPLLVAGPTMQLGARINQPGHVDHINFTANWGQGWRTICTVAVSGAPSVAPDSLGCTQSADPENGVWSISWDLANAGVPANSPFRVSFDVYSGSDDRSTHVLAPNGVHTATWRPAAGR